MATENKSSLPPLPSEDQEKLNHLQKDRKKAKHPLRTGFSDKTGWDWLQLLIQVIGAIAVPLSIIVGLYTFTTQQKDDNLRTQQQNISSARLADAQQQETTLQTYLNDMTTLLFDDKLGGKAPTSAEAAVIARSKTIIALSRLTDPQRKAAVVEFLYESHLIGYYDVTKKSIQPPIVDLGNANLSRADLSNATLTGADLSRADLSNATLTGADLSRADLSRSDLSNATLTGATMTDATLTGATMTDATLTGATLTDATLSRTTMTDANLSKATLSRATLSNATLTGADLNEADLSGADLSKATLSRTTLNDAILNGAILNGATLNDAILSRATLFRTTLNDATLSNATLTGADLTGADLSNADLSRADLQGTNITQQQLDEVFSCASALLPQGVTCHKTPSQ